MDVDGELAVRGPVSKLKRKRSSEHPTLRKVQKRKVFLQDLQYCPPWEQPNDGMWSSNVCDVNMNISVSVNIFFPDRCIFKPNKSTKFDLI